MNPFSVLDNVQSAYRSYVTTLQKVANPAILEWVEERRFLLRCELDALYFHLYGIERDDVD